MTQITTDGIHSFHQQGKDELSKKKLLGNLPFLRCDFGLPLYKYQNVCLSISNQNRSEEKECKEAFIEFLRESLFR